MTKEEFVSFVGTMDYEAGILLKDIPMTISMRDVDHPATYLVNAFKWDKQKLNYIYWSSLYDRLERYYGR
jgi:hypothetical protein